MSTFIIGLKVQARGNHEVVVKILGQLNLAVAKQRSGSRMTAFPCRRYANFFSINRKLFGKRTACGRPDQNILALSMMLSEQMIKLHHAQ